MSKRSGRLLSKPPASPASPSFAQVATDGGLRATVAGLSDSIAAAAGDHAALRDELAAAAAEAVRRDAANADAVAARDAVRDAEQRANMARMEALLATLTTATTASSTRRDPAGPLRPHYVEGIAFQHNAHHQPAATAPPAPVAPPTLDSNASADPTHTDVHDHQSAGATAVDPAASAASFDGPPQQQPPPGFAQPPPAAQPHQHQPRQQPHQQPYHGGTQTPLPSFLGDRRSRDARFQPGDVHLLVTLGLLHPLDDACDREQHLRDTGALSGVEDNGDVHHNFPRHRRPVPGFYRTTDEVARRTAILASGTSEKAASVLWGRDHDMYTFADSVAGQLVLVIQELRHVCLSLRAASHPHGLDPAMVESYMALDHLSEFVAAVRDQATDRCDIVQYRLDYGIPAAASLQASLLGTELPGFSSRARQHHLDLRKREQEALAKEHARRNASSNAGGTRGGGGHGGGSNNNNGNNNHRSGGGGNRSTSSGAARSSPSTGSSGAGRK